MTYDAKTYMRWMPFTFVYMLFLCLILNVEMPRPDPVEMLLLFCWEVPLFLLSLCFIFYVVFCIGFIPLFWGHPPMSWMSKPTTIEKLRPIFFSWNLLCKNYGYKYDYMMLMMLYMYCLHLPLLIKIKFVYAYVGPGSSQPPCQTGSGLGSWWRLGCEPGCPLGRKHGLS